MDSGEGREGALSPEQAHAVWSVLQPWLQGDEQGRALLEALREDLQRARVLLEALLARGDVPVAARIRVTGGNIGKLVTIGRTNAVHLHLPAPSPTAYFQLPADISDFTGRKREVENLSRLFDTADRQAPPVLVLTGKPGIGKSALAIHLAHRLVQTFPDAQLYSRLRLRGGMFAEAGQVTSSFLQALGVPSEAMPVDVEHQAALFRSELRQKRALIVLDDARDAEQVLPLLPASGSCGVIVTSRDPLVDLPGAHTVELSLLEVDDAVAFLASLSGSARVTAEPDHAQRIAQLCGLLPLAVRIAGARSEPPRPDGHDVACGCSAGGRGCRPHRDPKLALHQRIQPGTWFVEQ